MALVVLMVVLAGGWAATRSPLLDVDRIEVSGADRTGAEAVVLAAGFGRGAAMADIDEGQVRRRIRALPWVLDAIVVRRWPGRVEVKISERTPLAATPSNAGGWALVDAGGRVLEWATSPPAGGLVLVGLAPAGSPGSYLEAPSGDLLKVAETLPPELRAAVSAVGRGPTGTELALASGGTILVGDSASLGDKLASADQVVRGVELTGVAIVDVRLPATPTITRATP